MDKKAKELMKILNNKYKAELLYSVSTGSFYIASPMEFTDGTFAHSICEHRNNPGEAVFSFRNALLKAYNDDNLHCV